MHENFFSRSEQEWLLQNKEISENIFESLDDAENVNPLNNAEPDLEPLYKAVTAAKMTIEASKRRIIQGPYNQQHWEMINGHLKQPEFSEIKQRKFWNFFCFHCAVFNSEGANWPKERIYMEAMKECIASIDDFETFEIADLDEIADLNTIEVKKFFRNGVNSRF